MNCGDFYFETHYENELLEHVKMHIDQLEKHTANAKNGHKNTTWMLYEDWEYDTMEEEELVNHAGFFSILKDDEDDNVPTGEMSDEEACHKKEAEKATRGMEEVFEKEMSDEETRHKKEAEKAKEDEERWEENEKETKAETRKKVIKKKMYDEEACR